MLSNDVILKGIFLGLVLHAARILGLADHPCWRELGWLLAWTVGGLVVGGLLTLWPRRGAISRTPGALPRQIALGLLEDGWLPQAGLVLGLIFGNLTVLHPVGGEDLVGWFIGLVAAGVMLGVIFTILGGLTGRGIKLAIGAGFGLLIAAGMGLALGLWGTEGLASQRLTGSVVAGLWLLVAAVLYLALILTSIDPESEAELGCLTMVLPGLGLYLASGANGWGLGLGLMAPSLVCLLVGEGMAGRLRLAKVLLRARLHMATGNWRKALGCSSRALNIDPANPRALADFWQLTSKLDTDELLADSNARSLVRAERCLQWVARRLGGNPGPAGLDECERMCTLVERLDPPLAPLAEHWRVVADLHAGKSAEAMNRVRSLLAPGKGTGSENEAIWRQARRLTWLLALAWHDRLRQGVAETLLVDHPGAALEALEAIEEAWVQDPENIRLRSAWRGVVEKLDEARHGPLISQGGWKIDWRRVEGLGVGMLEEAGRLLRGAELVRLAASGNPAISPGSLIAVARALQSSGDEAGGLEHFRQAVAVGQRQGQSNLSEEDRELYFRAVKYLAEVADHDGRLPEAIRFWSLYSENPRSGLETLRRLAELHERQGDPPQALRAVEKALLYNAKDPDLLARRERYAWSLDLTHVEQNPEVYRGIIDTSFCTERSRKILDSGQADQEWLNLAEHLLGLGLLVRPDHLMTKLLLGRARSRQGDKIGAVKLWEEIRAAKPANWVEGESDDAWQRANQALGEAYLETGRPEEAIACLEDFRKSSRSGANTLFRLGQAQEALGKTRQARRLFQEVEGFEGNPLVWEAREALARLAATEAGPPGG